MHARRMNAEIDGMSSEQSEVHMEGDTCLFRVWDIPPLPITLILGFQVWPHTSPVLIL